MSDKCFCHLNGFEVKDKKARDTLTAHEEVLTGLAEGQTDHEQRIETLEQGTGSSGGGTKLYKHVITFKCNGSTQTSQDCTIISTSPTKITVGDFATNVTTKEQTAAVIDNLINIFSPTYTAMSISHMFFVEPTAYLYLFSWSGTGKQLSLTGVTSAQVTEL